MVRQCQCQYSVRASVSVSVSVSISTSVSVSFLRDVSVVIISMTLYSQGRTFDQGDGMSLTATD